MKGSKIDVKERILYWLEQHPGEYVSGEFLSEALHCSRTAIWKHIDHLRSIGFDIEAVKKSGYRLNYRPDQWDETQFLSGLAADTIGRKLYLFDEVESTQLVAHRMAREGAIEGTLILAEEQTGGRGRLGRSWHSPRGKGIWMSLILRPRLPIQAAPQMTLLTAVALARTLNVHLQLDAGIKWPNDIYLDGKKVSGILTEMSADSDRIHYIIVGIGINANLAQHEIPDELQHKATSLRIAAGREIDRHAVVQSFCYEFEKLYQLYLEEGFVPIKMLWEARSISLGQNVVAHTLQGEISGLVLEIDDIGALSILTSDGTVRKIFSADLEMRAQPQNI